MRELLILRKGIEHVLAGMAASQADDDQRARLQERFNDLEKWKDDPESYVLADGDFHTEVARISGVALASDLFELMAEPFSLARGGTALFPGGHEAAHRQHGTIFACILARNPGGASAAMYEHIQFAQDLLDQLEWSSDHYVLNLPPWEKRAPVTSARQEDIGHPDAAPSRA